MSQIIKLRMKQKAKTLRVAAYCRVSTKFERQKGSLDTQIRSYRSRIETTPGWELAGIFADWGRTGTNTKRPGFQQMLQACQEGKIDLILTKSVKRFNRNTLDLLETVRYLKSIGVGVFFELENIDTRTEESEMILAFIGSIAQDEIRNISENQQWSIRRRFACGESPVHRDCYGYRWDGHQYQPLWDQLEVVSRIYREFLDGRSAFRIANDLKKDGIRAMKGGAWTEISVKAVLTNQSYTGILHLQKTFTVDPISKKTKRNEGEVDQYIVPEAHPAVIDEQTWQAAQKQFVLNKRKHELDPSHAKGSTEFFKKVYCGVCGERMRKHGKYFRCEQTDPDCRMVQLAELRKAVSAVLGRDGYDPDWTQEIERIIVQADSTLSIKLITGEVIRYRPASQKGDLTGLIRCGKCGQPVKVAGIHKHGRFYRSPCRHHEPFEEKGMKKLMCDALGLEKFDYFAMKDSLDNCIYENGSVTLHFKDGRVERRNLDGTSCLQNPQKAG